MFLPDMHVPYQDNAAIHCVLQAVKIWKPNEIVIAGDMLDAAAFSSHPLKSMAELAAHRFIEDEVAPANWLLDQLQGPKRDRALRIVEGNHEYRIERCALSLGGSVGQAMYRMLSPRRLLGRRMDADGVEQGARKDFKWIPYMPKAAAHSHYKITKDLIAVHGWSIAKHAAATHLAVVRSCSICFGHVHRFQHVQSRDPLTNRPLHSWSPGCLSQLNPLFMAHNPNEWVHGFTQIYVGKDSWTPCHVHIDRGRCVLADGTQIYADKSWRLKDMAA